MTEATDDTILFNRREGFAVLTLNRPRKANAMDRASRHHILDILARFPDDCHALVITGAGAHFCAGIDLKERDRDVEQGDHSAFGEWAAVGLAVRNHRAICIAAVNGLALGGGLTLANCCDIVIASDQARFGMPELTFGVYPAMAGPSTQLTIARKHAAWMMFTAEPVSASEAQAYGIVSKTVEHEALLPQSEALAARIAGFDPVALQVSKRALDVIPAQINMWDKALEYGDLANAAIRARQQERPAG